MKVTRAAATPRLMDLIKRLPRRQAVDADAIGRIRHAAIAAVNDASPDIHQALLEAVARPDPAISRVLVEAGADPHGSPSSPDGYTPLHVAVDHGCDQQVAFLCSVGARTAQRNALGETALFLCARRACLKGGKPADVRCAIALLGAGASPTEATTVGQMDFLTIAIQRAIATRPDLHQVLTSTLTDSMVTGGPYAAWAAPLLAKLATPGP